MFSCQNNVARPKLAGTLSSSGDKGKERTVNKCMGEAPFLYSYFNTLKNNFFNFLFYSYLLDRLNDHLKTQFWS